MYKFKKSIAYILLIVIIASTSSAFAQSKPMRYPEPEGKGFYYYFNDAYWTRRKYEELGWKEAWTLTIIPNQDLTWGIFNKERNYAWEYLVARFSNDYRWKNQDILWQQFMCHARYGTLKEVWNLEPFRESSNFIDCN